MDKCSVYAISYGGYVGFRMAEICEEMVDKVVIMSSGIGATEEQMKEQVKKIGRNAVDLLLPENPEDLRLLMDLAIYTFDPFKWLPNCMLNDFIRVSFNLHFNYTVNINHRVIVVQIIRSQCCSTNYPITSQLYVS